MRRISLLPTILLTVLLIPTGISAGPLLRRMGAKPKETSSEKEAERLRALHREVCHWSVTMGILLLPMCGALPLGLNWQKIRRKVLAVVLVVLSLFITGFLMLLESFTGFMIPRVAESPTSTHPGSLLRFRALHVLGIPLLAVLTIAAIWIITLRISRRLPERSEAPAARPMA